MRRRVMSSTWLASLTVAILLCGKAMADVSMPDPSRRGLFYFFMSGQIVVVDAASQKVVRKIDQTSDGSPAPFPNSCPGHPLQGSWNAHTLGADQQTIFATASFQQPAPLRLPGLSDGVVVVDTARQTVAATVPVPDTPNDVAFVPEVGSVFAHADANGSFAVISALPPYEVQNARFASEFTEAGYGVLRADSGLNGKAVQTAAQMSGVWVLDLFTQTPDIPFIDLSASMLQSKPWLPPDTPIYCPTTREAVYGSVNRRVYVSCGKAGPAPDPNAPAPGIVAISLDDNTPVGYSNYKADRMFVTPDESFLLAVDSEGSAIRMLQLLPGVGSDQVFELAWPAIRLPANSMPDTIVFYPKDKYFVAYVSLTYKSSVAVIDFNRLLACGPNCDELKLANSLMFIPSGNHVPPNAAMDLSTSTRAMAVGHQFLCVAAAFDRAVHCNNLVDPTKSKTFTSMFDVQQIVFVEGQYYGNQSFIRPIDTRFDCSTAPTSMVTAPAPVAAMGAAGRTRP